MKRPYKARTLSGAQAYVRSLLKQREEFNAILGRTMHELSMLARMAADGPAFHDPMLAMAAKKIRDRELKHQGLNPDGSRIKQESQAS